MKFKLNKSTMPKFTKKGKAGDDMMSIDSKPLRMGHGGMAKGMMGGGSVTKVQSRGNGAAKSNTTRIC
jgi:hypothetical protein